MSNIRPSKYKQCHHLLCAGRPPGYLTFVTPVTCCCQPRLAPASLWAPLCSVSNSATVTDTLLRELSRTRGPPVSWPTLRGARLGAHRGPFSCERTRPTDTHVGRFFFPFHSHSFLYRAAVSSFTSKPALIGGVAKACLRNTFFRGWGVYVTSPAFASLLFYSSSWAQSVDVAVGFPARLQRMFTNLLVFCSGWQKQTSTRLGVYR